MVIRPKENLLASLGFELADNAVVDSMLVTMSMGLSPHRDVVFHF